MEPARIPPVVQDQILDVHYDSLFAPIGGKTDLPDAQKHGRIVKRNSLPDFSNSTNPFVFLSSGKQISPNVSEANENSGVGASKAISDPANSAIGPSPKKIQEEEDNNNSKKKKKKKKKNKKKKQLIAEEDIFQEHMDEDFCCHDREACRKAWEASYLNVLSKYNIQPSFRGGDNSRPISSSRALTVSKPKKEWKDLKKSSYLSYSRTEIPKFDFRFNFNEPK